MRDKRNNEFKNSNYFSMYFNHFKLKLKKIKKKRLIK